jgi:hypothetical protein
VPARFGPTTPTLSNAFLSLKLLDRRRGQQSVFRSRLFAAQLARQADDARFDRGTTRQQSTVFPVSPVTYD